MKTLNLSLVIIALLRYPIKVKTLPQLDEALLLDLFPPPSETCINHASPNTYSTFTHTPSESFWWQSSERFEEMNFLAQISSIDEANQHQSWKMRISQAGNIYSFRSGFGEAIPPQSVHQAPWIDEIPQMVSVDQNKNRYSGKKYFIHQSGVYKKDYPYTAEAFYSPSIGKYCSGRTCIFGTWAQQAHLRTKHRGVALYFNMYTDCGGGVIEHTLLMHNTEKNPGDGDRLTYHNIPWSAIRKSTLLSVFIADSNRQLDYRWPLKGWNDKTESLSSTGGFITFAENVVVPDDQYNNNPFKMPVVGGETLKLVVKNNWGQTTYMRSSHSNRFNSYCVSTRLEQTVRASRLRCTDCRLWFTNSRTGFKFTVEIVIHWAWCGTHIYYCTEDITAAEINENFLGGDEILVSHVNDGKPKDENLALTLIYGNENPSVHPDRWANSRLRFGKIGDRRRDGTIFTVNSRVNVEGGDVYLHRQHIMTGDLSAVESDAPGWLSDTYEDMFHLGELEGRNIKLYAEEDTFGVAIGEDSCYQGELLCIGRSVPSIDMVPYFFITCGNKSYIGPDNYHFSPPRETDQDTIRSYVCDGESNDVRPTWKLLGYFKEAGECGQTFDNANYVEDFCEAPSKAEALMEDNTTACEGKWQTFVAFIQDLFTTFLVFPAESLISRIPFFP